MNNELAPGVIALIVGLIEDVELNGLSVELYELVSSDAEIYYDPIEDCLYYFSDEDFVSYESWGCIIPSRNEYLFFHPKNLLPIGKKESQKDKEKELDKEDELCKST